MSKHVEIGSEYTEVQYLQFTASRTFRLVQTAIGVIFWPVVLPLALLSRFSDIVFRALSEFFSLIPYFPGVILRYEFYRFALRKVGKNVLIEFGTIFIYRDVEIGSNVLIGRYNVIHHCDFGHYVMTGERCTFLSGSKQHHTERGERPIALQGGLKKRIKIGDDVWIGVHAVLAENVGQGSIVTMGSVVAKPVPENTVVIGNPARFLPRPG